MKDFKELKVWHKAYELSLALYEASRVFPREEIYGLTSQLRRAAVSIGANIAEDGLTVSWSDFYKLPGGPHQRLNIICCWREI